MAEKQVRDTRAHDPASKHAYGPDLLRFYPFNTRESPCCSGVKEDFDEVLGYIRNSAVAKELCLSS